MLRRFATVSIALLLAGIFLAACGATAKQPDKVTLASASMLPKQMQEAPVAVRTAYQFAVAHPDALKNVPCYCGCGDMGHTSNLSCYVKEVDADGKPVFDDHALGCSICVDIAQDVMKMTGEGKSPSDIRQQIVATYSQFGPANQ